MTAASLATPQAIRPALLALLLLGSLPGCGTSEPLVRASHAGSMPLPSALPSDVDMDGARLQQSVLDLPAETEHRLRSMLVMRRGKLVLEHYWNGRDRDVQQDLRSATKSITSLLLGAALGGGFIKSVHETVHTHLGTAYPDTAAVQRNITVEDLLTMRSGADCDDRDPRSPGQEDKMYGARDWVRFFLELPAAGPAGEVARYCTGGVVALGRILSEAGRSPVPAFADKHLFGPLGIPDARWSRFDDDRQTDTGGHLFLRPRDMLRIGQLVLQRGVWNGRQLVPREWIEQSTREHTRIDNGKPYGYLWWRQAVPHGGGQVTVIFAAGNGGQCIFIVPELELVAVFTGGNYNSRKAQRPFRIMTTYIVPAVRSEASAPAVTR